MNIVFIHLGDNELPLYLIDNLIQTSRLTPRSKIHLIASSKNIAVIRKRRSRSQSWLETIALHDTEHIPRSNAHAEYVRRSALDRSFRDGFWYLATLRFFVLHDFMCCMQIDSVLHLENDVVLYTDPMSLRTAFESFSGLAVPLDRTRAIPGVVWCSDERILQGLTESMLNLHMLDDMRTIGLFFENNSHLTKPLPTIPTGYAMSRGLGLDRYSHGESTFGGIFDAAAIGQYLGGIDPRNAQGDSRFFKNESSDLDLADFDFAWDYQDGIRKPVISFRQSRTTIHAIHVHSKNVAQFSPFAHTVPRNENRVITGERIQALANVTISRKDITAFHGRDNIRTSYIFEVPDTQVPYTSHTVPTEVLRSKIFYVYTHLLSEFRHYILPFIQHRFILITGNSDHGIGIEHLSLMNDRRLARWYGQNVNICHPKVLPIPIGIENNQWWKAGPMNIIDHVKQIQKNRTLYVNFSTYTNLARREIYEFFRTYDGATIDSKVPRPAYLDQIRNHRFVVAPRGNGLDTHRFWEALYLGAIPVISRDDWCPSFSRMPVLIVDRYQDVASLDLNREYIKITTSLSESDAHLMPTIAEARSH
jgi:hypothetical protein